MSKSLDKLKDRINKAKAYNQLGVYVRDIRLSKDVYEFLLKNPNLFQSVSISNDNKRINNDRLYFA